MPSNLAVRPLASPREVVPYFTLFPGGGLLSTGFATLLWAGAVLFGRGAAAFLGGELTAEGAVLFGRDAAGLGGEVTAGFPRAGGATDLGEVEAAGGLLGAEGVLAGVTFFSEEGAFCALWSFSTSFRIASNSFLCRGYGQVMVLYRKTKGRKQKDNQMIDRDIAY